MSQVYVGNSSEVNPPTPVPDLHVARYIVSAGGTTNGANYTTIAAAYAAAVTAGAPQTVFIQPGTYTENVTLVAGINLCAFDCDAQTPNVTIIGKISASFAGVCSISGINLQTNSDYCISLTGAVLTDLRIKNCFITASNHTAIQYSSSLITSRLRFYECEGNISTTGITLLSHTAAGTLAFHTSFITNTGLSTTVSVITGTGALNFFSTDMQNGFQLNSTGILRSNNSRFDCSSINITPIDIQAGTAQILSSILDGGTAASFNTVSNNSFLDNVHLDTTNANPITGTGTVNIGHVGVQGSTGSFVTAGTGFNDFLGKIKSTEITNSNGIVVYNGSNLVNYAGPQLSSAGIATNTTQPAFLAYLSSQQSNVTGDGTTFQIPFDTMAYDIGSNFTTGASAHYTFPVTGKYSISTNISVFSATAGLFQGQVIATSRGVQGFLTVVLNEDATISQSVLIDATAGDTLYVATIISGGVKTSAVLGGTSPYATFISGYLVC